MGLSSSGSDIDETLGWVSYAHSTSWGAAMRRLDDAEDLTADDELL